MFGYRTGETPVVHVHVKKPKPFKWLRKLFRRLKFRHARFEDGKYLKGQQDIEKWRDDDPLTKADYPDYRWQALNKAKTAKRSSRQKLSSYQAQDDGENNQYDISVVQSPEKISKNKMKGQKCDHFGPDSLNVQNPLSGNTHNLLSRFTKLMRNKKEHINESASKTIKTAQQFRASISGYSSLEAELSTANSPTKSSRTVQVEINSPDRIDGRNYTDWLATEEQKSIEMNRNPFHPIFGQGFHDSLYYPNQVDNDIMDKTGTLSNLDLEITPSQHEHDNDKNHMLILERKNSKKKTKSRKHRKKRARRKGKYTELEVAPSVESFNDIETNEEDFTLTPKRIMLKGKTEKVSNVLGQ